MGDNLGYFIGRRVGTSLVGWLRRQKRFRFITPQALERGRAYFRPRAAWAVFITRFLIVALGGPVNIVAGLEQYPYPNFLFWDISGQILGAIIPLGLGYVFARSWEEVAGIFGALSSLFLALLVFIILFTLLVRKIRQRRRANSIEVKENDTLQPLNDKAEHNTGLLLIPD